MTRIALIHAVYVAMAPIDHAFKKLWPEAQRVNLVDDALSTDLTRDGQITPAMSRRIRRLAEHALDSGADGILFTCSAFGSAIEEAALALAVPVLKPNEAMFEAALDCGQRLAMIATFEPAVKSMEEELLALAKARGIDTSIETICVPEAMAAARRGDIARHDRLVAEAVPRFAPFDALMLAHFSTSTALEGVALMTPQPVLSAPEAAVSKLKLLLTGS